jgi:3D (Asp-Asp-Asp) domain-containing protein
MKHGFKKVPRINNWQDYIKKKRDMTNMKSNKIERSPQLVRLWIILIGTLVLLLTYWALTTVKKPQVDKPSNEPLTEVQKDSLGINKNPITAKDTSFFSVDTVDSVSDTINVSATFYNPVGSQTDDSPDITATGFKINTDDPYSHRIIAVSRDLEKMGFNMGDKVVVDFGEGRKASKYNGVYVIQDRMNKRYTQKIDLLVSPEMYMGHFKDVTLSHFNG